MYNFPSLFLYCSGVQFKISFSEKPQVEGERFESDNKKLVIAETRLQTPLKSTYATKTLPTEKEQKEKCCTTPTSEESKIPTTSMSTPHAPRKRKPSLM